MANTDWKAPQTHRLPLDEPAVQDVYKRQILPSAVGAESILLMVLSVLIIGCVTFCICVPGVYLGKKFGKLLSSKAEIFGGLVLIAIGLKICIEHLFFS